MFGHIFPVMLYVVSMLLVANGELFSSVAHMEQLLSERIRLKKQLLFTGSGFVAVSRTNSEVSMAHGGISHPIDQYFLLKDVYVMWNHMDADFKRRYNTSTTVEMPNAKDLTGAVKALFRLQLTYKLPTKHMSAGNIIDSMSEKPLGSDDCLLLAKEALRQRHPRQCHEWSREAKKKYSPYGKSPPLAHILLTWSECLDSYGMYASSFLLALEARRLSPHNKHVAAIIRRLQAKLDEDNLPTMSAAKLYVSLEDLEVEPDFSKRRDRCDPLFYARDVDRQMALKCYVVHQKSNLRMLFSSIKIEEINQSPHIIRYVDLLLEHEIEQLKKLSRPGLSRAMVWDAKSAVRVPVDSRITQNIVFENHRYSVIDAITERIGDVTGLYMGTSDELQVANYGIGGYYSYHYDAFVKGSNPKLLARGNRIATALLYLSDVVYGGNTVFPEVNLSISPLKGSVVTWFNMLPSGERDLRTLHSGCPVLHGSKWIANKWIREDGQNFEAFKSADGSQYEWKF